MTKLKLGAILDEKPVRLTVEIPASVYRDLLAYAEALANETGQILEPAQLFAPMTARFMAADREFRKARREGPRDRSPTRHGRQNSLSSRPGERS